MKIWEPKPPRTLWATPGPLRDSFTFTFLLLVQKSKERITLKSMKWSSSLEGSSCWNKQEVSPGGITRFIPYAPVAVSLPYCLPRKFIPQTLILLPQYLNSPIHMQTFWVVSSLPDFRPKFFTHFCVPSCLQNSVWNVRQLGTCNRTRFQKSNKTSKLFRPGHVCLGHTCWPHITIYSNHVVSFAFRCCKCHVVHK
jgi:hypothetical protein